VEELRSTEGEKCSEGSDGRSDSSSSRSKSEADGDERNRKRRTGDKAEGDRRRAKTVRGDKQKRQQRDEPGNGNPVKRASDKPTRKSGGDDAGGGGDDDDDSRNDSKGKGVPRKAEGAKDTKIKPSDASNQATEKAETPVPSHKWMKPDKFDGSSSAGATVETFLAQFGICAEYNGWSEADKGAQLKCCLKGSAGQLLWDTGKPSELTFEQLTAKLRQRFGSVDQEEKYIAELKSRRRRRNETLGELHQDLKRLMALAYPGEATSKMGEIIARDYFITALDDRDLALKIAEKEARDLETAYRYAVRLEAYEKAADSQTGREAGRGRVSRVVHDDVQNRVIENDNDALETRVPNRR